jgi:hypothetical protein
MTWGFNSTRTGSLAPTHCQGSAAAPGGDGHTPPTSPSSSTVPNANNAATRSVRWLRMHTADDNASCSTASASNTSCCAAVPARTSHRTDETSASAGSAAPSGGGGGAGGGRTVFNTHGEAAAAPPSGGGPRHWAIARAVNCTTQPSLSCCALVHARHCKWASRRHCRKCGSHASA